MYHLLNNNMHQKCKYAQNDWIVLQTGLWQIDWIPVFWLAELGTSVLFLTCGYITWMDSTFFLQHIG